MAAVAQQAARAVHPPARHVGQRRLTHEVAEPQRVGGTGHGRFGRERGDGPRALRGLVDAGERRADLLQAVLYDLGLPHEARGEQELRLALTDHLLTRLRDGQRTVLVVDEAQHLTPALLEQLRLLRNLEAGLGKAVQVVLPAQPTLISPPPASVSAGSGKRRSISRRMRRVSQ